VELLLLLEMLYPFETAYQLSFVLVAIVAYSIFNVSLHLTSLKA